MSEICDNLSRIKDEINSIELRTGRQTNSVKLLAVSKFHPVEKIIEALSCNQFLFGENRVQEAMEKFPAIIEKNLKIDLHMIGVLQSNKIKNAVKISSCIESVNKIEMLDEIEKQCSKIDKIITVLFEYHTGEESKSGFTNEDDLLKALSLCNENLYPHIKPNGFMTMAPFTDDKKLIHKSFSTLRTIAEKCKKQFPLLPLDELSMGMSNDFDIAIEEGSTLVRVGTAIFGEREY
jgi:PLP dependent protein